MGYIAWYCRNRVSFVWTRNREMRPWAVLRPFYDVYLRVEETQNMKTHKILESRQPVRRPRFCTNSPSYKNRGCKLLVLKFYIVFSVHYGELYNSRNNNNPLCYNLYIQYFA